MIESDEDDDRPEEGTAAAASVEHVPALEKSKPVRFSSGITSGKRRSTRAACLVAKARNKELLSENDTNPEVV